MPGNPEDPRDNGGPSLEDIQREEDKNLESLESLVAIVLIDGLPVVVACYSFLETAAQGNGMTIDEYIVHIKEHLKDIIELKNGPAN